MRFPYLGDFCCVHMGKNIYGLYFSVMGQDYTVASGSQKTKINNVR